MTNTIGQHKINKYYLKEYNQIKASLPANSSLPVEQESSTLKNPVETKSPTSLIPARFLVGSEELCSSLKKNGGLKARAAQLTQPGVLLFSRESLGFPNLRSLLSTLLKALNVCLFATLNNKRILFVGDSRPLVQEHQQRLLSFFISSQAQRDRTKKIAGQLPASLSGVSLKKRSLTIRQGKPLNDPRRASQSSVSSTSKSVIAESKDTLWRTQPVAFRVPTSPKGESCGSSGRWPWSTKTTQVEQRLTPPWLSELTETPVSVKSGSSRLKAQRSLEYTDIRADRALFKSLYSLVLKSKLSHGSTKGSYSKIRGLWSVSENSNQTRPEHRYSGESKLFCFKTTHDASLKAVPDLKAAQERIEVKVAYSAVGTCLAANLRFALLRNQSPGGSAINTREGFSTLEPSLDSSPRPATGGNELLERLDQLGSPSRNYFYYTVVTKLLLKAAIRGSQWTATSAQKSNSWIGGFFSNSQATYKQSLSDQVFLNLRLSGGATPGSPEAIGTALYIPSTRKSLVRVAQAGRRTWSKDSSKKAVLKDLPDRDALQISPPRLALGKGRTPGGSLIPVQLRAARPESFRSSLSQGPSFFCSREQSMHKKVMSYCQASLEANWRKNPWLKEADLVFFTNPSTSLSLLNQINRLKIPTIGIINLGSSSDPSRRAAEARKPKTRSKQSITYPIIGNSNSLNFLRIVLTKFASILVQKRNTRVGRSPA